MMGRYGLRDHIVLAGAFVLGLLLTACGTSAPASSVIHTSIVSNTPSDVSSPVVATISNTVETPATRTAITTPQPKITAMPLVVGMGTQVTVSGSGFPGHTTIVVRLGLPGPGAGPRQYASSMSTADGYVTLIFPFPTKWPDGKVMDEKTIVVVASTEDGHISAMTAIQNVTGNTTITPQPDAGGLTPTPVSVKPLVTSQVTQSISATIDAGTSAFQEPINASVDFLNSLLRDPSGASSVGFLSQRLRAEISNNWVLPTGLGIQPGYNSFVVELLSKGDTAVVVQATLTYESGASVRNFTMIKEGDYWRIDNVVAGSR
jgi:hypothetical protein